MDFSEWLMQSALLTHDSMQLSLAMFASLNGEQEHYMAIGIYKLHSFVPLNMKRSTSWSGSGSINPCNPHML